VGLFFAVSGAGHEMKEVRAGGTEASLGWLRDWRNLALHGSREAFSQSMLARVSGLSGNFIEDSMNTPGRARDCADLSTIRHLKLRVKSVHELSAVVTI
jgi:hypothetical protein